MNTSAVFGVSLCTDLEGHMSINCLEREQNIDVRLGLTSIENCRQVSLSAGSL